MTPSESSTLAAAALDRLAPRLPEAAAPDGGAADAPSRRLYALIADRLRTLGEQDALAELVRDPRNNSLVKRLLATAATEDRAYATELAAAVGALPPAGPVSSPVSEFSPPAGAAGRDARRPRRYGLWVGVAAVVVLLLVGALVARTVANGLTDAGGLTADSSCTEYRQAPPEERVAAIRQIGLAKGISGVDSPLVMTAVNQLCEAQPSAKLGDLVARFDG